MKLIDVASAVKAADSDRLGDISVSQIQRILSLAMREIRGAVLASEEEMLMVPGLGRFRSRMHDVKASPDSGEADSGEEAGQRRVIKFFPARTDREGRAGAEAEDLTSTEPADHAATA